MAVMQHNRFAEIFLSDVKAYIRLERGQVAAHVDGIVKSDSRIVVSASEMAEGIGWGLIGQSVRLRIFAEKDRPVGDRYRRTIFHKGVDEFLIDTTIDNDMHEILVSGLKSGLTLVLVDLPVPVEYDQRNLLLEEPKHLATDDEVVIEIKAAI